jgi:benzoyl-CoA reductase/2-hydroxyglutaryl-CoA dehydratase subunit BcrC/BadD/HgdB
MTSKPITLLLAVVAVAALAFGVYTQNKVSKLSEEMTMWKTKYEEALIDAEDAGQRIEKMKEELEAALKESEKHRAEAEAALQELQKRKGR